MKEDIFELLKKDTIKLKGDNNKERTLNKIKELSGEINSEKYCCPNSYRMITYYSN